MTTFMRLISKCSQKLSLRESTVKIYSFCPFVKTYNLRNHTTFTTGNSFNQGVTRTTCQILKRKCYYSTEVTEESIKRSVGDISEKFSEAISLLDDARQSLGTIYFSEDLKDAEELVTEILTDYKVLLDKLTAEQKASVMRTIGLKMNELKAQMEIVQELCKE